MARETKKTIVESNGSRWAGQEPAPLSELFDLMAKEPLDWDLFNGNFLGLLEDGSVRINGNFLNFSHVFCIDTSDKRLLSKFAKALNRNYMFSKNYALAQTSSEIA